MKARYKEYERRCRSTPELRAKLKKAKRDCYLAHKEKNCSYSRAYHEKHREERRVWMAKYRKEKKAILAIKAREYRERNPETVKQQLKRYRASAAYKRARSERRRERRSTDISFRVQLGLRTRLQRLLRGKIKAASAQKLLGCTFSDLITHLESRFLSGMSWENYGRQGWHIDHVIPCAAFDLSQPEQQRLCFSYKNLQPLWALDNLRKNASLPEWLS
jgi:hypothetical protein